MKDIMTAPFVEEMKRTTANMYRLGWDERNGGNISYMLEEEEVAKYLDLDNVIREIPTGFDATELIGKIYIIEARFTSEINALEDWAVSEYNKTPKPEKAAKKKELAATGFPKLTALEKSCDAEVNAVLEELSEVLKNAGQSTELVNQIKSAYTNKKKLTKSYYISEYM